MIRTIFAGVLAAAAIGAPALAQDYDLLSKKCYDNMNPDGAISACSAVIAAGVALRNDLAMAFKVRGNAYDEKGQHDIAILDYNHAMTINPADANTFNDRGTSYRARGQYDLAIADYDQSILLTPNAMVFNNRCFAKAVVGQLEQGLADCNESLRLRPKDANTLASRGFVHLKLKRYEAAIADYNAEFLINPGNPFSLYGRGIANRMTGKVSDGDADMAAAKAVKADIAIEMAKLGVQP